MATLAIINKMIPDLYDGSTDVETFIVECKRYFSLCNLEQEVQNVMIKCLIARDILPMYEAVEEKEMNFDERLRKAFKRPTTLITDFLALCNYEKDADTAPVYFEKIEKMVDQLLKHKWDKDELTAYFLVNCVKDKDTQKEIKMREALKVEDIKDVIRKVDAINMEVSGIAVMQRRETFANVVKKRQVFADLQERQQNNYRGRYQDRQNGNYQNGNYQVRPNGSYQENYQKRQHRNYEQTQYNQRDMRGNRPRQIVRCWNCQSEGHMSRECPKQKVLKCFSCGNEGHMQRDCRRNFVTRLSCHACKEEGHQRRECPSISCSGCGRKGHLRFQCWNQTQRGHNTGVRDRQRPPSLAACQREDPEDNEASRGEEYPNENAPSCDEMIGAMN